MTADPALREALARVLHGQFAAFFDRDVCAEAADAILSSGLVVGAGVADEARAERDAAHAAIREYLTAFDDKNVPVGDLGNALRALRDILPPVAAPVGEEAGE